MAELRTAWLGGRIAALLDWLPASFITRLWVGVQDDGSAVLRREEQWARAALPTVKDTRQEQNTVVGCMMFLWLQSPLDVSALPCCGAG